MGSEQFSLCWDNFHRNMSSGMHSMLESEDLVDVTLAIEGQYLKAHKMVLSVCSPYFRKLFSMNPCKHPIFFMKDVSYEVMNDLLTFMYQGEVQVNQENLGNFIKTAEALQIRGLTNDSSEVEDVEGKAQKRPATDEFRSPNKSVKKVPAPVVKRPKLSAPVNNNPPGAVTPCILNTSLQRNSAQPGEGQEELKPPEVVQFKMEPYDAAEQCENYETDGQDGYTEEDSQLDEDYSTLESDEPKAGTSGDSIADTQGIVVVVNKRGSKLLLYDNNLYHNYCKQKNGIMWRCVEYKKRFCPAKFLIDDAKVIKKVIGHNHKSFREDILGKLRTGEIMVDDGY